MLKNIIDMRGSEKRSLIRYKMTYSVHFSHICIQEKDLPDRVWLGWWRIRHRKNILWRDWHVEDRLMWRRHSGGLFNERWKLYWNIVERRIGIVLMFGTIRDGVVNNNLLVGNRGHIKRVAQFLWAQYNLKTHQQCPIV